MMLSQFTQALSDAKCSVELDSNFVKGYIRVSKCCVALGDAISAQQAIDKALQIEPNNAAALQEKSSIQQLVTYLADYNQAYQAKDYRKVNIKKSNKNIIDMGVSYYTEISNAKYFIQPIFPGSILPRPGSLHLISIKTIENISR